VRILRRWQVVKESGERISMRERVNAIEKMSHHLSKMTPLLQERRSTNMHSTEAGGREQVWEGRRGGILEGRAITVSEILGR